MVTIGSIYDTIPDFVSIEFLRGCLYDDMAFASSACRCLLVRLVRLKKNEKIFIYPIDAHKKI